MTAPDADAARKAIHREHPDVVAAVDECASAVAESWGGERAADASAVSDPLEARLDEANVLDVLPEVLADAVDAAGGEPEAPPVAAPPYVVVTSRGPVLRATLDDGRLVLRIEAFRVTDDGRYERAETSVRAVVR